MSTVQMDIMSTPSITTMIPPSPALSQCDSLADIEDLDAFLNAQGPLSYFPTPGLEEMREDGKDIENYTSDNLLSPYRTPLMSSRDLQFHTGAIDNHISATTANYQDMIERLVSYSDLPEEVMAIAHLILEALLKQDVARLESPFELLTVSALSLAEIHISDHPHSRSYWSRMATIQFCELSCHITAGQIDRTVIRIMEALNWSIHALCHPVAVQDMVLAIRAREDILLGVFETPTIKVDSVTTLWINGQLTPASSSPATAKTPSYFAPAM